MNRTGGVEPIFRVWDQIGFVNDLDRRERK